MDIDKLFKVPKLPSMGNKRKLPDNPTPDVLKKMRMDTLLTPASDEQAPGPSSENSLNTKSRRVTVEDVEDEDGATEFAPGGDADYFVEEDEEGRFFGSGLTSEQKEILNIFDSAALDNVQDEPEDMSVTSIRRMLLKFERAVNKNQDQRSKYPNDPSKFIDSEADLDAAIKSLTSLAQAPLLAYPEIVKSETVGLLIGLLTHDNMDIVIDVVELIHELTDEDITDEYADDETEQDIEGALKILIEGFVENSILELLVDNLSRMNETEESDRQGVFHVLGIFENIIGFNPNLSVQLVSKTTILTWILKRMQAKEHDENRGYAAELLSILLQNSTENRLELSKQGGVDVLLKVLSQFRRRNPIDADETEFMENVFDSLCSALSEPSIKELFRVAEGPDLMVLMMKEKLQSKSLSIKTLDFAMSGEAGAAVCDAFVDALGLKTLFSAFMGKEAKKTKAAALPPASQDMAHVLGIISSLFSNLSSDSPNRIRLLMKFVEGNYEKIDKLVELRDNACSRLKATDAEIMKFREELTTEDIEITEVEEDAWYLRRLDGGLFTLQTIDYILAWVIMEDDGVRTHVLQMLNRKNLGLPDIVKTLRIYYDNIGEGSQTMETDSISSQKLILQGLIDALSNRATE